jgi:hypothetical protein
MTAKKQRRVLTSITNKLAAHHNNIPSDDGITHPLHEWMLPDDDPQRLPLPHPTAPEEQRVTAAPTEQRVTTPTPIRRITNAPPIMAAPNPTNKRLLKTTLHSHMRLTRNNIPGDVPAITLAAPVVPTQSSRPKRWPHADHHAYPR